MAYLIDTDILIYLIKGNHAVDRRLIETESIPKAISVITFGELLFGAKKSIQKDKNIAIVYRLSEVFPIIEINRSTIETFTEIKATLEKDGERIEDFDLLIAATALGMNYTLVTNNTKHYQRIESLKLENWKEMNAG
jgi:tRNA(fMet)-specific endonuclease VapC